MPQQLPPFKRTPVLQRRSTPRTDEDLHQEFRRIMQSKFATDTLEPIMGNPGAMDNASTAPLEKGVLGMTELRGDKPELVFSTNPESPWDVATRDTPASTGAPRNVVTHEMTHMAKNPRELFPSFFAVNRTAERPQAKFGPSFFRMEDKRRKEPPTPREQQAFEALDPYYASRLVPKTTGTMSAAGSRAVERDHIANEGFAQAMVNAVEFLAENAKGPQEGFRERLGQLEGNTPGTGQIVQDLLTKHTVYRNHPLASLYRPQQR